MARDGGRFAIDWQEVFGHSSSPDREDVCFASRSSAPHAAARAGAAAGGVARASADDKRRRGACPHRMFRGLRSEVQRRGVRERGPRAQADDEASRPVTPAAAKAAAYLGPDARSATKSVYTFNSEDEEGELVARKYCLKSSPFSNGKKNYRQLNMNKGRSPRHGEQRKPISVDKMYSGKPSSTTLSGNQQRVHAIDPEESDRVKRRRGEKLSFSNFTKRRKEQLQDSSSFYFQKVQDVVLLDDEDMQPEEELNCGMPEKRNEPKIYYPSRDDSEAVELTSSDIKCLDPGVYLSSPVINYYIQYIKRNRLYSEDCRDKFYIFNTYFYRKLEEALLRTGDFSKLRRWWKGVNIFHRAYIVLPIHGMAHWSLIIICMPAKEIISGPIILHLDSLGMHPSAKIFDTVERYLVKEWCHVKQNPPPDTSMSDTIWEDLPRNIHMEKVQVPQQNNEYDCGVFMLYYIERFIREAPERFTRDKLDMFNRSWFKSEDASELRQRIRKLLLEEFESARLDDAMSDAAASDSSDIEGSIKGGELEAGAASESSEMVVEVGVELGDTGKSNEGVKVAASEEEEASCSKAAASEEEASGSKAAASEEACGEPGDGGKSNEGIKVAASEEASGESGYTDKSMESITEVAALDEAPISSYKRDEKSIGCVLLEAATFSDSVKDEEDTVKADSDSSKTGKEESFVILSPDRLKNDEGVIRSTLIPDVVCDSCDSDTDEVKIVRVRKQKTIRQNCWIS